jgi:quinol monooxygenase YgiN
MDDFIDVQRASYRVALKQRGRSAGGFRGRDLPPRPPPLTGPIARLATVRPRSGDFAPIASEYETSLRGLYALADGCLGAQLLWDPEKGEATSLTLWASVEHLEALTKTDDYARRMASLAALLVGTPDVRSLQLLAHVNRPAEDAAGSEAPPGAGPGA